MHHLRILGFGFSSGLPFLLILSTLSVWVIEQGYSTASVGALTFVTLPYAVKFLWAPILERMPCWLMPSQFGQKRGWLLCIQIFLCISFLALSVANHIWNIYWVLAWAFAIGFFSAMQDILIEAFRLQEAAHQNCSLFGANSFVLGYRLGMLVSGGLALYFSAKWGWGTAYQIMALFMSIGILCTLYSPEPHSGRDTDRAKLSVYDSLFFIKRSSVALFKNRSIGIMIGFIFCYKLIDISLQVMSIPFLMELGFSKATIAEIGKTFGIFSMIVGVIVGGTYLKKYQFYSVLWTCFVLQIVSTILFGVQALCGAHVKLLILTIGIENFSSGLSQVVLVVYFSNLCRFPYWASHYALLSSIASLIRVLLSMLAGMLASYMTWPGFYFGLVLGVIPGCFLLWGFEGHFKIYPVSLDPESKILPSVAMVS